MVVVRSTTYIFARRIGGGVAERVTLGKPGSNGVPKPELIKARCVYARVREGLFVKSLFLKKKKGRFLRRAVS